MRHNWKRLQDALNGFVRLVSKEPLVDFGDYIVDRLQEEINTAKVVSAFMRKVGIHGLLEIVDRADTYWFSHHYTSDKPKITAKLFIPWSEQLKARYIYGGCFPDDINRTVQIHADNVARVCEWTGVQSGVEISVQFWFYRRANPGEKVDGCRIERRFHTYLPDSPRASSFLTASCQMKG